MDLPPPSKKNFFIFFCPYVYPQLIQLQSYRRQKENLFLRHSYFASLFCLCMERIKCPIFFLKKRATPGLFMFIFALTGPINMASFLFLFIFNQLQRIKAINLRGIRNWIARVEGEHDDHLTTTATRCLNTLLKIDDFTVLIELL